MTSHSNSDKSCIPPLKFEHVKIAGYKHFLVLDVFRGPVCYESNPATHPAGWVYFPQNSYNCLPELKGKLMKVVDLASDNGMWRDIELTFVDDSVCEIAQKAYKEYQELSETCGQIKANRYPEAGVLAPATVEGDLG